MLIIDFKTGSHHKRNLYQIFAYKHLIEEQNDAISDDIHFEEDSHCYIVDSKIYPSVSKIIETEFPLPKENKKLMEIIEKAGKFGTYIHYILELHDLGKLDLKKLDKKYHKYIVGWENFKQENKLLDYKQLIEIRRASKDYGFCGTIDRVFPGYDVEGTHLWLVYIDNFGIFKKKIVNPNDGYWSEFLNCLIKFQIKNNKANKDFFKKEE